MPCLPKTCTKLFKLAKQIRDNESHSKKTNYRTFIHKSTKLHVKWQQKKYGSKKHKYGLHRITTSKNEHTTKKT